MDQNNDILPTIVLIAIAVFVLAYVVSVAGRLGDFFDELRYINMELGRCSANMRHKWHRRRRRLWYRLLIPFYRG